METGEFSVKDEKDSKIEQTVKDLTESFKGEGINYFIIGSLARNMYMGKETQSPEVDLLIPNQAQRQKAETLMNKVRTANPGIDLDTSLSNIVLEEGGKYFLTYGNIKHSVDPQIFEPSELHIGVTNFNTLNPPALLHTYTFVGGPFRGKDWSNALTLSRWMKQQNISYDHSSYSKFHQFGKDRWKRSPLRQIQNAWRAAINSLPDEARNKILEVYKTPIVTNIRDIFNRVEKATCGVSTD